MAREGKGTKQSVAIAQFQKMKPRYGGRRSCSNRIRSAQKLPISWSVFTQVTVGCENMGF